MEVALSFFLFLTREHFIIPFVVVGFFLVNAKAFTRSLVALLGAMVLAAYLKSQFQIPLKPHLGVGWALPSGHMLASTAFWGVLAWELRQRIMTIVCSLVILGIGIALVHFNYHDPIDVIAAGGFGLGVIGLHAIVHSKFNLSAPLYTVIIFAISGLMAYHMAQVPTSVYTALGALSGLFIGGALFQGAPSQLMKQILGVVLCIGLIAAIVWGFGHFKLVMPWKIALQGMAIGFSLHFSSQLASRI